METGIAVATLGLIISCVLGGPLAKYLIEKYRLHPSSAHRVPIELAPEDDQAPIDKTGVMRAILVVNIAVILGYLVHDWISNATTIKVPLFVPCLIMGMVRWCSVDIRLRGLCDHSLYAAAASAVTVQIDIGRRDVTPTIRSAYVRLWPKADIAHCTAHGRFWV